MLPAMLFARDLHLLGLTEAPVFGVVLRRLTVRYFDFQPALFPNIF